jgi:hypothetical protein
MRLVSWKYVCVMAIVFTPLTGSATEQTLPTPSQPTTLPTPAPPIPLQTPAVPQEAPRRPQTPQGPNIRIELTITDQAGMDAPVKKTLSVIAADRHNGYIRSKVAVGVPMPDPGTFDYLDLPLNVDTKAELMENGLIRLLVILNYETVNPTRNGGKPTRSVVTVTQTVMLENGKPLVVSQSADAATDRKVSLEVKATILK